MARLVRFVGLGVLVTLICPVTLRAQFPSEVVGFNGPPIDDPATSQEMFQQPQYSGSTSSYIVANTPGQYDWNAAFRAAGLQTEGAAALEAFFNWVDTADAHSWARLTTYNGPERPNPSLDTRGKVRFNITNRGELFDGEIGICLGIRETGGVDIPQLADGGTSGLIEWVGVTGVMTDPNDPNAVTGPIPAITLPPSPTAYSLEWDLSTGVVRVNGTPQGGEIWGFTGNGTLADCPDDRGTLEHIAITNVESDVAVLVNFAIDELQFEATVADTIPPPTISAPVVDSDTEVRVQCIDLASEAELYVNGGSVGTEVPVDGVATFTGLSLSIGNILTATQTANNITSAPSEPVVVMASAPTVEGPIEVGATSVTVSNVRSDADLVTVYVNTDTYPVDPMGQAVVVVPVDPIPNGSVVRATQTVDGTESPFSNAVIVGDFLVYVNEFNYDDSLEPDDHAFVELYNGRDEAVDIGGWVIQIGDYIEGQDPPGVYYQVFIPPGTTIAPHGYWTVGMSAVADWPGAVVDLIDDNLRLDNGENYVALRLAGALVDAIAWEMNKSFTLIPADIYTQIGTGIWGNHVNWDNTNIENYEGPPTSQSRFLDGLDTDENGRDVGIQPATPGYSNNQPDLTPYFQNGSSLIALDPVPGWAFSYKPLIAFDPSVVDSGGVGGLPMNPSVIPPSPDEGLALMAWDEVGGGNVAYMGQLAKEDFTLETYIYIPPAFTPEGYEETKIGIRGSADGVHNFDWYNGATGVCWLLQHGTTWQTLYLLDENDGDDGNSGEPICATILGTIDIGTDAGLTGWQRLLLETSGDTVLGIFGGTYGSREDGIQFTATHECPGPGGVYISYREAVPGTATARPATFDAFSLTSPSACVGDVDGDGDTDLSDLATLLGAYGTAPGHPNWNPACDFDGDDDVDLSDLAFLLGDYGCV